VLGQQRAPALTLNFDDHLCPIDGHKLLGAGERIRQSRHRAKSYIGPLRA
jgi:hypothetical protein